ncbi:transcription factor ILI2-like [Oryza brachyantha]|uniref:transcription factor ILI2-like n=1 Tax=Oryza brachyantha TaxID=4533 RepID=UPI001ADC62CC|nr:transcription factor ILI2-like [Oryza brachyantha]
MASRRSRPSPSSSPAAAAAAATDEQMAELMSKLQAALPANSLGEANGKVSSAEVLQEACRYIRRLHREADALSERLAELLLQPSDRTINGADASDLIRSLLMSFLGVLGFFRLQLGPSAACHGN